jgi:hypothetical protein
VVKGVLTVCSSRNTPTVPIRPDLRLAAARPARTRKVVVVLPLVPVTPKTGSARDGCPYTSADNGPSAARGSGVTSTGGAVLDPASSAAPAGSVSTATAPAASAWSR